LDKKARRVQFEVLNIDGTDICFGLIVFLLRMIRKVKASSITEDDLIEIKRKLSKFN